MKSYDLNSIAEQSTLFLFLASFAGSFIPRKVTPPTDLKKNEAIHGALKTLRVILSKLKYSLCL